MLMVCWKVGLDEKVWCSKASFEVNEVCSSKECETLQACWKVNESEVSDCRLTE
jgi:hypothetical protein